FDLIERQSLPGQHVTEAMALLAERSAPLPTYEFGGAHVYSPTKTGSTRVRPSPQRGKTGSLRPNTPIRHRAYGRSPQRRHARRRLIWIRTVEQLGGKQICCGTPISCFARRRRLIV